jgi:saccharopine dehydrogenase-like NADP-dependent oxidoreductase
MSAHQLDILRPDILVDASGPFQAYGDRPYALIEACIAHSVHYLDLADGSDFVAGVSAFDNAAREAGLYVLSGVSTCPVLTAGAVRRLSHDMTRVDTISAGIAPSPFARVGGKRDPRDCRLCRRAHRAQARRPSRIRLSLH